MATHHQSGSWTSPSILAGYGLSAVIGPVEPTSQDLKRLNSRSGGASGKGNWMQTFNPRPIQGSGRPKKMYNYDLGEEPVIRRRLPGLEKRKVASFKGFKKTFPIKKLAPATNNRGGQNAPVNNGGNRPGNVARPRPDNDDTTAQDLIAELRAARRERDEIRRPERYVPPRLLLRRARFNPQPRQNNAIGPNEQRAAEFFDDDNRPYAPAA